MKKTTYLLSTSALALLLSTSLSYGSASGDDDGIDLGASAVIAPAPVVDVDDVKDNGDGDDDDAADAVAAAVDVVPEAVVGEADEVKDGSDADDGFAEAVAAAHKPRKWGDVDGDGDRDFADFKLWIKGKLDFDGDGDFDFDDIVAGAHSLFKKVHKIFDADGDGDVEFDEILIGTHKAIGHLKSLTDRVLAISGTIQDSPYFDLIPADVKGPLTNLMGLVDEAAGKTQAGLNIGGKYIERIEDALEALKAQVKHLTDGDLSREDMIHLRKDIFAYLEMIKGWHNTGDNTKLITDIEEKLAKVKLPEA